MAVNNQSPNGTTGFTGLFLPVLRPLWKLFDRPAVYRLNQLLTGYLLSLAYKRLLRRHLKLSGGETLLDIGCGTGDYAPCFPEQKYIGLDFNPDYITRAREVYGHLPNVSFLCQDINALREGNFLADHAYCVAVTHHLTDEELVQMVQEAIRIVKHRFVVVDLYLPEMWRNPIGHILVKLDRGRYGRPKRRLIELLKSSGVPTGAESTDFGFPYPAMAVTFEQAGAAAK